MIVLFKHHMNTDVFKPAILSKGSLKRSAKKSNIKNLRFPSRKQPELDLNMFDHSMVIVCNKQYKLKYHKFLCFLVLLNVQIVCRFPNDGHYCTIIIINIKVVFIYHLNCLRGFLQHRGNPYQNWLLNFHTIMNQLSNHIFGLYTISNILRIITSFFFLSDWFQLFIWYHDHAISFGWQYDW